MEIYTVIEEQDPPDNPIVDYISKGTLPHEQNMPRRITPAPAQRIELRDGVLPIDVSRVLRHGYLCVGPIQADYVLCEIHAGSCSMHSGPRSVVARALRSGYYWPTMHRDARDMIKKLRGLENSYVAITTLLNGIEAKRSATITGNQAKKQSDQASRQISKQASGSANAPYDLVFTAMGPPLGTTQTTATITSAEGLQRATFTTPPQTKIKNLDTHENNDWRISVRDRLGSRDVHSRLGQRHSPSESPPSSDSEDSRRSAAECVRLVLRRLLGQRGRRNGTRNPRTNIVKTKTKICPVHGVAKRSTHLRGRISDFSEDKKRRMPANVKNSDGTGILTTSKILRIAAPTIEKLATNRCW
ncbi:hypothetical protein Tco_1004136 [Tanacetum coccineum]|uniref:Integrase zinc-binding domain-containing protein n=1 Tax=Tanacetum coccineum TaxID=301880 RepID=A0ABQ5FCF8_9ASTR